MRNSKFLKIKNKARPLKVYTITHHGEAVGYLHSTKEDAEETLTAVTEKEKTFNFVL